MKEQKTDDFVIGRHPAMAALKSGQDINKVFVQSGLKSDFSCQKAQHRRFAGSENKA